MLTELGLCLGTRAKLKSKIGPFFLDRLDHDKVVGLNCKKPGTKKKKWASLRRIGLKKRMTNEMVVTISVVESFYSECLI